MPRREQWERKSQQTNPAETRANQGLAGSGKGAGSISGPVRVCVRMREESNNHLFSPKPLSLCAGADECRFEVLTRDGCLKLFTLFPKRAKLITAGLAAGWVIVDSCQHCSHQRDKQQHPGRAQGKCQGYPPIGTPRQAPDKECSSLIAPPVAALGIC